MRHTIAALALSGLLFALPALAACGQAQSPTTGEAAESAADDTTEEAEAPVAVAPSTQKAASSLDGAWIQEGHELDANGMVGAVDGETIALWVRANGSDWSYWTGSLEKPGKRTDYTWTSKADRSKMGGLVASRDDLKDFRYADGKISFVYEAGGEQTEIVMEQVNNEKNLLANLEATDQGNERDAAARQAADESVATFETVEVSDLVVDEFGYTLSNGYVRYAVSLSNPNEEYAPQFVHINVTGRAEDGSIRFSDNWTVGTVFPGAKTCWANQAGDGTTLESDSIEVSVTVNEGDWYRTDKTGDFYEFGNLSTQTDALGFMTTTGEITLLEDVELSGAGNARTPMIVAVMRDEAGNIIGGYHTYVSADLRAGEATPFEVMSLYQPVECAEVDVYANPW